MAEEKDYFDIDSDDEVYVDTSSKILELSDKLAEDIILENIEEQLEGELDPLKTCINYVSLFKEKYSAIDEDDEDYDRDYIFDAITRVASAVNEGLKNRYEVEVGDDLEIVTPVEYLNDMETLYEFLYIRNYENLVDYFKSELYRNKEYFIAAYSALMEEDAHAKDLFVVQSKKKFKNKDDVLIMHFLNDILNDIRSKVDSGLELFKSITELDIYEEYNNRMSEMLINYGDKIVLNHDAETAKLYLKPLDNPDIYAELRNTILMDYLEKCELNA